MATETIADDRLKGVPQIADFLGETERKAYHLLYIKAIPAGKIGGHWIASKTKLRAHYDKVTSGE